MALYSRDRHSVETLLINTGSLKHDLRQKDNAKEVLLRESHVRRYSLGQPNQE